MDWTSSILADLARLLQYAGAVVLFGTAVFNLVSLPRSVEASASRHGWPKPLFLGAGIALLTGAIVSLLAQSASMNGIPLSKLDAAAIKLVLVETQWGHAIVARMGLSVAALAVTFAVRPSASLFAGLATLGLVCLASFAFTGHGAADDGPGGVVHLVSDMSHSVAAGVWLGALAGFFLLLRQPAATAEPYRSALAKALAGFATTGTVAVTVLVASGLVNGYFLIGLAGLPKIFTSAYGELLVLKLVLFMAMLALAATNRFRLTPALRRAADATAQSQAIAGLRRSVILEALAGLAILALVAVFGMLEPPSAM
jgi:putative copper resistance protein D